jgi:hypothetical protein
MTQVAKCEDPECDKPLGEHTEEGRDEGGRMLVYRYHKCPHCGLVQATSEDLQWNAKAMQEFYGESVKRSMTWTQRWALLRAQAWCLLVNGFYRLTFPNPETWYLRCTVMTDLEGKVLKVTACDHTDRIIRRFWEA